MFKIMRSRLTEGSSWAAISTLLLASTMVMGDEYQHILGGLGIGAGVVAILLPDRGRAS